MPPKLITTKPIKNTPERSWHLIDAKDKILGKVAVEIATLLRGKHKAGFRRHNDLGDLVVVTNAADVVLTGNKEKNKEYHRHSMYPGGLKTITAGDVRQTHPELLIKRAVMGMLPKTKQRDLWMTRLKIYAGAEHPHKANIR